MSQPYQKPGQLSVTYTLYRNRKKLTSGGSAANLSDYIAGFEIYESMTSSTMEARFIVVDAGGLINTLTGSELMKVDVKTGVQDRVFFFRIYQIVNRSRGNQGTEIYMLNGVSDEFLKKERYLVVTILLQNLLQMSLIVIIRTLLLMECLLIQKQHRLLRKL